MCNDSDQYRDNMDMGEREKYEQAQKIQQAQETGKTENTSWKGL